MTISIGYTPAFTRQLGKLEFGLQEEVEEKVDLFRDRNNHAAMRVHKLHGPLADRWSFSVNYRYRVLFVWENKNTAILVAVGDHEIYDC